MAKSFRQKSGSSDSRKRKPARRTSPSDSNAKIRKLPVAQSQPTMRSENASAGNKKSGFSLFKKKQAKGRHSIPLDSESPSNSYSASSFSASGSQAPNSNVRLESQTIGQIKQERKRQIAAEERRQRSKKRKRRARIPLIITGFVVALAIGLVGTYFALSNSDTFKIETIDITGTDHLTKQEVSALVSVPQGTTLLTVDEDAIVNSLARDAWIESIDVNKIFPNKLEIVVHERSITAVAEIPMGENQDIQKWAISKDGYWLMAIPDRNTELGSKISEQIHADADSVLHITDIEYGVQPEIGAKCSDPAVLNALEIITGMTTSLAKEVKVLSAPDVDSTMLVLNNNVEVSFGDADDIRDKERICLEILKQNPKVVYINVRVLDRPTWRSA